MLKHPNNRHYPTPLPPNPIVPSTPSIHYRSFAIDLEGEVGGSIKLQSAPLPFSGTTSGTFFFGRTLTRMLIRSLLSSRLQSLRFLSSKTPHVLKPGDVLRQTRIFTDEDVLQYSKVSHDSNPLHFDSDTARNVGFEAPLVHGMLVAALFPHIISSHFPGALYVSQSLNFKFPVYIGDQIIGEVQATNLRENKNRYLAKFKTRCFKNGELVLEGEAMAILQTLTMEEGHCKEQ